MKGSSTWNYAIELDYDSNGVPVNATVYKKPLTITYSNDAGYNFGAIGLYGYGYSASDLLVPVEATSTDTTTTTVTWHYGQVSKDGNNTNINNTVAIDLSGILGSSHQFDFVWGTTTCANGPVYGEVPICSSVLLLGSGLLGLVGLRRWKWSLKT
jgi:hypothetical protein